MVKRGVRVGDFTAAIMRVGRGGITPGLGDKEGRFGNKSLLSRA